MKIKKIVAVMLAAMTLVSTCTSAFAADQVFTEDGTAQVTATAEITSSYKVKLPAMVTLAKDTNAETKNTYGSEYTVGVAGNIDSDKFVNVEPDTTDFVLKDASGKRPVTPELTAEKVAWSAEDLDKVEDDTFVDSISAVSAVIPKAGKYSGVIVYNFALGKIETRNMYKEKATLSLDNYPYKISKVTVDDKEYKWWITKKIPVKEGSVVTLYHDSSRRWTYNTVDSQNIILGTTEACRFMVPFDASGTASLYFYDGSTSDGVKIDNIALNKSSGWAQNIIPELVGEPSEPKEAEITIRYNELYSKVTVNGVEIANNNKVTIKKDDIITAYGAKDSGSWSLMTDSYGPSGSIGKGTIATCIVPMLLSSSGTLNFTNVYGGGVYTISRYDVCNSWKFSISGDVEGTRVKISYDKNYYSKVTINDIEIAVSQEMMIKEGDIIVAYGSRGTNDWRHNQYDYGYIGKGTKVTCVVPPTEDSATVPTGILRFYYDNRTSVYNYYVTHDGYCGSWKFTAE